MPLKPRSYFNFFKTIYTFSKPKKAGRCLNSATHTLKELLGRELSGKRPAKRPNGKGKATQSSTPIGKSLLIRTSWKNLLSTKQIRLEEKLRNLLRKTFMKNSQEENQSHQTITRWLGSLKPEKLLGKLNDPKTRYRNNSDEV